MISEAQSVILVVAAFVIAMIAIFSKIIYRWLKKDELKNFNWDEHKKDE